MDPILGVIFICWCIKVFAEDGWSTVKGQSNPRMDRRKARQKSRAGNPIWTQFVGWLGDVAQDAREEQGRARQEKRERQAEERRKRELAEHETVDAEVLDRQDNPYPDPDDPSGAATPQPRTPHEELDVDDCNIPGCPVHHPAKPDTEQQTQPDPQQTQPDPSTTPNEGDPMSEITGLDQSIAYAKAVKSMAAKHGTAGNEGYIGHLTERNVTGEALQSAHDMQAAMSGAMAAAAHHESELLKQKAVQEQYDANSDAGDKQFQTEGR